MTDALPGRNASDATGKTTGNATGRTTGATTRKTTWNAAILVALLLLSTALPARAQDALPRTEAERLQSLVSALPHPLRAAFPKRISSASRHLQDAFDVSWYHLNLNLDVDRDPELIGHVRVLGMAVAELDTVQLDLESSMEVLAVLSVSGKALTWTHHGDQLLIIPEYGLLPGDEEAFDVVYRGNPTWDFGRGGYESGRRSGGDVFMWTLSEPYGSMAWWPTEDHPADKADSVQVTLTVPTGIVAVSNGRLASEVAHGNGTTTFDWVHRYPISTYLVSIAAGEFDRTVQTYSRPPDLVDRFGPAHFPVEHYAYRDVPAFEGISETSGWRLTPEVMAVFERWFGPYPFAREKYGNAHFTLRGGMEHQTVSSMGNIGIELIAHELAHQWVGDSITPSSWKDLWLNEGFATLGEMLAFESDPVYTPIQDLLFDIYYNRARDARGTLVLSDTTDALDMFSHARVYAKGWMVLRMIRQQTGNVLFQSILETWASRHEYDSATTGDFKAVVEDLTGEDWSLFFDQWVFSGWGEPRFALGWTDVSNGPDYRVQVVLEQIQSPAESNVAAFAVPMPVAVHTAEGIQVFIADVDERTETLEFALTSPPLDVELDPDRWILHGDTVPLTGTDVQGRHGPDPEDAITLVVAPHPAVGSLRFDVVADGGVSRPVHAELYDMLGRRVWQQTWSRNPGREAVSVSGLASGRYLLRVRSGSLVKERLVLLQSR